MKDRKIIMKMWDTWRKYISGGGGASWPRDGFEILLDSYDEELAEVRAELEALREKVRNWKEAENDLSNWRKNMDGSFSRFRKAKAELRAAVEKETA